MDKYIPELKRIAESSLTFIQDKLFAPETLMILNCIPDTGSAPTPDDCKNSYPNPAGYDTEIEDCTLAGGTLLDACISLYNITNNNGIKSFAQKLAEGLLCCAEAAASEGFIPRGICRADKKSHYIDSSRDQYTLFVFSLWRYYTSDMCTDAHKDRIKNAFVRIAHRAERNVSPENNYDMLRDDGGKTLVSTMWGDNMGCHETMRLPMIYLCAYHCSEDEHFLELYKGKRDEAIKRAHFNREFWTFYALHQMQVSLRLCYELESEPEYKEKLLELMREVTTHIADKTDYIKSTLKSKDAYNLPHTPFDMCEKREISFYKNLGLNAVKCSHSDEEDYFVLQNCADAVIIPSLDGNASLTEKAIKLFIDAYNLIDLNKHERNLPVYFCLGAARALENYAAGREAFKTTHQAT